MGIFRAISNIFYQAAKGFSIGVLVIMTVIVGVYYFQRYENELVGLPIVQELTDTYKEGLRGLGDMASVAVKEFYESRITEQFQLQIIDDEKEGPSGFVKSDQLVIPSSWNKDELLKKLQNKGFSKRKMEQAHRYVDYIEQYKDLALRDMVDLKVLASIKLAQGILESNAGDSKLATNTNNHFGIKANKQWQGPVYWKQSVEHNAYWGRQLQTSAFRRYQTIQRSYQDFGTYLRYRGRYDQLFQIPENDYVAWANEMQRTGYASDVNYAQKLIRIIEYYGLHSTQKVNHGISRKQGIVVGGNQ